jgi:hypothetical protein
MDLNTELELLSNKHKLKKNDKSKNDKSKQNNNLDDLLFNILEMEVTDKKIETSLKNLNKLLNDIIKKKNINTKGFLQETINILHYVTKKNIIEELTYNQLDTSSESICKELIEDLIKNVVNLVEDQNNKKNINVNFKENDKKGMEKFIINKI